MIRRRKLLASLTVLPALTLAGCTDDATSRAETPSNPPSPDETEDETETATPADCPPELTGTEARSAHLDALRRAGSATVRLECSDDRQTTNVVELDLSQGRLYQRVDQLVPDERESEDPFVTVLERYRSSPTILADLDGTATYSTRRNPDGESPSVSERTVTVSDGVQTDGLGHLRDPIDRAVDGDRRLQADHPDGDEIDLRFRPVLPGGLSALEGSCDYHYSFSAPRDRGTPSDGTPVLVESIDNYEGLIAVDPSTELISAAAARRYEPANPPHSQYNLQYRFGISFSAVGETVVSRPEWLPE